MAVGGIHPSDVTIQSSEVHALNPSTGLWELITNIPVSTSGAAVVGVADNKIIVLEELLATNRDRTPLICGLVHLSDLFVYILRRMMLLCLHRSWPSAVVLISMYFNDWSIQCMTVL